jgi:hypothetical protein
MTRESYETERKRKMQDDQEKAKKAAPCHMHHQGNEPAEMPSPHVA